MESLAALAALLFVKHLIADGPLQTPYQLANKGKLLHPGGLLHAGVHVALTGLVLAAWLLIVVGEVCDSDHVVNVFALIMAMEYVVHYCADWFKCQADKRFKWSVVEATPDGRTRLCISDSMFFIAFLIDQTVHSLTYVWMVYLIGVSL